MRRGYLIAAVSAGALLFWALARHPYDYYMLLRWVVFGVSVFGVSVFGRAKRLEWGIVLGILALLFNPVIPVHMGHTTWAFFDVVGALIIVVSGIAAVRDGRASLQRSVEERP